MTSPQGETMGVLLSPSQQTAIRRSIIQSRNIPCSIQTTLNIVFPVGAKLSSSLDDVLFFENMEIISKGMC